MLMIPTTSPAIQKALYVFIHLFIHSSTAKQWTNLMLLSSEPSYTKYDVQCHMVFYVDVVTFQMTLLMA